MDLLNKLDTIKIDNISRIDDEDLQFCLNQQRQYDKAMDIINEIFDVVQNNLGVNLRGDYKTRGSSNNVYLHEFTFKDLEDVPLVKTELFIDTIIRHFREKYKIILKSNLSSVIFIQKHYDYNNIIDYIYEQLEGLNFLERAKQDIINATKSFYSYSEYRDWENVQLKKDKVFIDGYFARKNWKNDYVLSDSYLNIFRSLNLFDKDSVDNSENELILRYCGYSNENREDAFDKYELKNFTKVKSIKFLKNGKMELVFISKEYASEFAYNYLGYENRG